MTYTTNDLGLKPEFCQNGRLEKIERSFYTPVDGIARRPIFHFTALWSGVHAGSHETYIKFTLHKRWMPFVQREHDHHTRAAHASTHVLPLHDIILMHDDERLPCVATTYYPHTLSAARRVLSPRERALVLAQACEGIIDVHNTGLVHCDVKPDNIIITDRLECKLIDFDAACEAGVVEAPALYCPYHSAPEVLNAVEHRAKKLAITRRPQEDAYSMALTIKDVMGDALREKLKGTVTLNLSTDWKRRPGVKALRDDLLVYANQHVNADNATNPAILVRQ